MESATQKAENIVQQPSLGQPSALPWKEVAAKKEFKALDITNQTRAKLQYFDSVVASQIPDTEYKQRRGEFLNYAARLDNENHRPSFWREVVGQTILKAPQRTVGMVLGAFSAIPSFALAGLTERELNREEFDKMPLWEQALVAMGAGFESAAKATFKEGEWGTRYSDYYKATTGETIEESLPEGFKWAAPTLEFLAEASFDPILVEGGIGNILGKSVPKHWIGKMPPKVYNDLKQIEALEVAEKQKLQESFLKVLEKRKSYMEWWEDRLGQFDLRPRGGPLLTSEGRGIPPLEASQNAMAGQPKRGLASIDEKEIPQLTKELQEAKTLGKLKATSPDNILIEKKINEFRKSKGWGPVSKVSKEDIAELRKADTLEKLNAFRKKKGVPVIQTRATAGLIAGIEEDENGNITYDIGKGLAGGLAVAGGMSFFNARRQQKFAETMMNNSAWAKVNGTVGKLSSHFSLSGLLGRLNTAFFDRFATMKGFSLKTYAAARTFSAYKDEAAVKFNELREALKPVKDDEVIFSDYVNAHRMASRAKVGIKNPDNVTFDEAKKAISQIEEYYSTTGKDVEGLRQAFKDFQKWTDDYILKEALESGVISEDGYKAIKKGNEFYAAFEVLDHIPPDLQKIPGLPGKEYFSVSGQKVIQKMTGTEKKIANPIEATVKKFTEAQGVFARNKVANVFIDDPNTSQFLRPVATSKKEFAIMKNQGKNPIMEGQWNKSEFGTVNRLKDGRVERYVTDVDMANAMKRLTPYQAPRVIQAINGIFRKSATTVYLPFTISNAFRDALMAYTTAPVYKTKDAGKFFKDWGKGFWEGMKHEFGNKSDLAKEYIESGGGFGYVGNLRKPQQATKDLFTKTLKGKAWSVVKSPVDLLEKVSAMVELAPRLGTFQRAKIAGVSSKDAALIAKQSTIDFNRGGTFTKVANQWIPFLNARVQGRVTVAAALKRDPKGTLSKIFVSTVVPGMSAYAWNRLYHSDLYDDIPEYIKQNYFTLITGTEIDDKGRENPKYIVIPKGDVGQLSWNPIEFGIDKMWEKDREGAIEFLTNYLSDLSPVEFARQGKVSLSKAAGSLLPPVIKGFAEDWANLSFYRGNEIVPYYMGKSKPPELQYKENTPESYKWLGKKLGVAPLRLQNFASNILAGYGREGLSPSAMMRGLTGRLVKTTGGEQQQQAWTAIKDIEQGYTYIQAYAKEMVKEGDISTAVSIMKQWNAGIGEQVDQFNTRFGKYGIEDRGGILKSYAFSRRKVASMIRAERKKATDQRTPLERKLSRK